MHLYHSPGQEKFLAPPLGSTINHRMISRLFRKLRWISYFEDHEGNQNISGDDI
jgi:hypothetical protein